jgi:antibiotic biosynthesis monooxygenase (ABM) superfamily enzyme
MREEPVTVVVRRRVKPGAEAAFESAMQEFIGFALAFPSNRGIHVLRTGAREYTVVDRFADVRSRQAFKETPKYRAWMTRLRELSETDPYIEERAGLGGWFTLPGAPQPTAPAQLKMALVTFLGVLPLTAALPPLFGWLLPGWHPQLANVLVTALIVALLAWPVMPLLTRLFSAWLYGKAP